MRSGPDATRRLGEVVDGKGRVAVAARVLAVQDDVIVSVEKAAEVDLQGIGTAANVTTGALSNATALGYLAFASASNYVRIGNTAVTAIFGAVGFNTSDGRFKTNVKENVPGLDFIMRLRPVTYHFEKLAYSRHLGETRDSINESELQRQDALGKVSTGFIAQEVEQLADSLGYDFDGLYKPQNDKDSYGIAYQQFVVPLIKAVQEQQKIIAEDRERITRLEKQNAELLKLVNKK